jgi:hypothetical protein
MRVMETMEEAFFSTPNPDDDKTPWGLKYWITKNASAGFNGSYASGFSTIANINLTQVPQFKNYTDQYTTVSKDDLITKMRRAHRRTQWKSPKQMAGFDGDSTDRRIILCNEDTVEAFENIGEGQNENLGRDLAPMNSGSTVGLRKTPDGEIVFKRKPIIYAEPLDDDTSDPIYGIDLGSFYAMVRKGDNMRESDFKEWGTQHDVFVRFLDHAPQFICANRRSQWVISK